MQKQPLSILIITLSLFLLAFTACDLFTPTASAHLVIQSGVHNSASRIPSDYNKTTSVDGLRLWVHDICVELPQNSGDQHLIFWEAGSPAGEMIDLRSASDVQRISENVELPLEYIQQIRITFMDHFSIKTWVNHTDGKYYYTTAGGVASASGTFDPDNPPAAYDFYHYSFVHPTTGIPGDETIYQTQYVFYPEGIMIDEDKEYVFEIYVDLVNLVNFWDGTPGERGSPFSWGNPAEGYTASQFYPDNVPAFGSEYIPFCFIIYEATQSVSPVMETYISSYYQSDLETLYAANSIDLTTLTYVFLNPGDTAPIYGSSRGQGLGGDGVYANFTAAGAGAFDFFLYHWEATYDNDYSSSNVIATVSGFPRLAVGEISTFDYDYDDGQATEKYVMRIE